MPKYNPADAELLAELAAAVAEQRAIPTEAIEDAQFAFTQREMDNELAILSMLYDSLLDQESMVRDASLVPLRTLTFQRGKLSLEIEVSEDSIIGQVIPEEQASVTIGTKQAAFATVDTDEWGSFIINRPATGPVRLIWNTTSGRLMTDWFTL